MERKELIKITTKGEKQTVSARELYEGLGYNLKDNHFSRWIKIQLNNVDAIENIDFTTFWFKNDDSINGVVEFNGSANSMVRNGCQMDYEITVDIAKEICMVVVAVPKVDPTVKRKSKEIRKYFIECERIAKEKQVPQLTEEEKLALQLYHGGIEAIEANKKLIELKTTQLQPKADYHDEFMNSEGLFTPTEIAARFNLSAEDLNNMLKEKKLIKRVNGTVLPTKKMPKEWYVIVEGTNNGYAYKQMYYNTTGDKSLNEMLRYYEKPKKKELFEQKNFFDIFR